jgi:hypothetical protein
MEDKCSICGKEKCLDYLEDGKCTVKRMGKNYDKFCHGCQPDQDKCSICGKHKAGECEVDGCNSQDNCDCQPEDELYEEAKKAVIERGFGSTPILQRKLKIGHARAERLLDSLTSNGVLGPADGAKPRKVINCQPEGWEKKLEDFEMVLEDGSLSGCEVYHHAVRFFIREEIEKAKVEVAERVLEAVYNASKGNVQCDHIGDCGCYCECENEAQAEVERIKKEWD